MQLRDKAIYLPGHTGLVGSALQRLFTARGCSRILTREPAQLDLRRQPSQHPRRRAERHQLTRGYSYYYRYNYYYIANPAKKKET